MRRRDFVMFCGAAAASPIVAHSRVSPPRIGVLLTGASTKNKVAQRSGLEKDVDSFAAFRQGLSELGYDDGKNIKIEQRTAEGALERFRILAAELVEMRVDIIVAMNSVAGRAAKELTDIIPIVVPVMGDPIGDGLVSSLSRPGSNVTGSTFLGPELLPKRVGILKEAFPTISRVTALCHLRAYSERTIKGMINETETAAKGLGLELRFIYVQGPDELDLAFSDIAEGYPDALLIFPSPMLFNELHRIAELTAKHRLASMAMDRRFVQLGGLLSYGANISDLIRRSATYVDKIINGFAPANLPVQQPTKFELFINAKTANMLGLTIPATLLAQADQVIE